MFWVIRGTDPKSQKDFAFVVEATSLTRAEAWALKRGIPAAFVGKANKADIREARQSHRMWRYSKEPRYKCLGKPVMARQLACLLIAGLGTIGLIVERTVPQARQFLTRATITKTVRTTRTPRIAPQQQRALQVERDFAAA